jgi:hypothetical protein
MKRHANIMSLEATHLISNQTLPEIHRELMLNYRFNLFPWIVRSRVSSGSIVSDYDLDDRAIGIRSPRGQRTFLLSSVSRPALGPTQPPVQWVPVVLSPGVQARPGRDADHSPLSSAEVENE